MPNPTTLETWDTFTTATLARWKSRVWDNVSQKNAFFVFMHTRDRMEMVEGGRRFEEALEYAFNDTWKGYETYDTFDLRPQETLTQMEEVLRQIGGSVVISDEELLKNRSRQQKVKLMTHKLRNGLEALGEELGQQLLVPRGASMAHAPKEMNALTEIIVLDPTTGTVHNIDRATYTFWRNNVKESASNNGATITLQAFKNEIRNFYNTCNRHREGETDLGLTTQEVEEKVEDAMDVQVRYTDTKLAEMGFDNVRHRKMLIMWDQYCPRQLNDGGAIVAYNDANADEHPFYFINTRHLKLWGHSERNIAARGWKDAYNQDAMANLIRFWGQLACVNMRTQGLFHGINPATITG